MQGLGTEKQDSEQQVSPALLKTQTQDCVQHGR